MRALAVTWVEGELSCSYMPVLRHLWSELGWSIRPFRLISETQLFTRPLEGRLHVPARCPLPTVALRFMSPPRIHPGGQPSPPAGPLHSLVLSSAARIHYLRDGCTYGHRQRCMESMLRCLPFRNAPTTQAQSNRQPCKTGELSPARSFPARCCCPFGRSAC